MCEHERHPDDEDEPRPWEEAGVVRRDCEPHRGPTLQLAGRAGLPLALVSTFLNICWPLAVAHDPGAGVFAVICLVAAAAASAVVAAVLAGGLWWACSRDL